MIQKQAAHKFIHLGNFTAYKMLICLKQGAKGRKKTQQKGQPLVKLEVSLKQYMYKDLNPRGLSSTLQSSTLFIPQKSLKLCGLKLHYIVGTKLALLDPNSHWA